ncbi:MAG TPA: phage tail protein [Allosphingosinicella sp.]|nr:phage tail protein [Allosphingosinicella sp.]
MPGLGSVGNVTLKQGAIPGDSLFWGWFNDVQLGIVEHRTVIISLLDGNGAPMMIWNLANAFPLKNSGLDAPAEGEEEVAVESLDLASDSLTVKET